MPDLGSVSQNSGFVVGRFASRKRNIQYKKEEFKVMDV
jgi:hypothetical protein